MVLFRQFVEKIAGQHEVVTGGLGALAEALEFPLRLYAGIMMEGSKILKTYLDRPTKVMSIKITFI